MEQASRHVHYLNEKDVIEFTDWFPVKSRDEFVALLIAGLITLPPVSNDLEAYYLDVSISDQLKAATSSTNQAYASAVKSDHTMMLEGSHTNMLGTDHVLLDYPKILNIAKLT